MDFLDSINGNEFICGKQKRYLFKSKGVDLEQFSPEELYAYAHTLKNEINQLPTGKVFKFYGINGNTFLDSFQNGNSLRSLRFEECNEGVEPFFSLDTVYSDPDFSGKDFVKVNGIFYRFISISPEENTEVDFGALYRLGDYFVLARKIETFISKNLVNDSRRMNSASLFKALSDIEGIEAYQENEEVLRQIVRREEELFRARICFVINALGEEELFDKTASLLRELKAMSLGPKISNFDLIDDFLSFTPGLVGDFSDSIILKGSLLVNCLPIHKDFVHKEGVSFTARSGRRIFVNVNAGSSYSSLFTGQTGSGKTFTVQKLLVNEIDQGKAVFIIDPKRDYEKFALLNDFRIVDENINPMVIKDDLYLRNLILSRIPEKERSRVFEGKLLRAIRESECYLDDNFFTAISKLEKKGFPELEYYFEDMKEKISTEKESPSKLIYILSSTFTDETLPFILTYAFEYLKKLNLPYKLVIDEAHRVFKIVPHALEEKIREVRVLNSGLWPITQSYNYLTSSKFGEVVADNCEHEFYFRQELKSSINFKDHEVHMINSFLKAEDMGYSECLYKNTKNSKVIQFHPTLKELELFKSGEKERVKMLNYIKNKLDYLTVDEAVNSYVREKYGNF